MVQPLSDQDWHNRFQQQASWTRDLRRYLYDKIGLRKSRSILDVGCGTGALFDELSLPAPSQTIGIDLDLNRLRFAEAGHPQIQVTCGDALHLPFQDHAFDLCLCHYVFLWLPDPRQALQEMRRVTRPGGIIAALAEPDYGGRIDHPLELVELGHLQGQALQRQGADPLMGRKLAGLFNQAGLVNVETGLLGGQWSVPPSPEAWTSEWAVLENDLRDLVSHEELQDLKDIDRSAWAHGERILFVPTFYAFGEVKFSTSP